MTTKSSESTTSDNHIDRLHVSIARNTQNAIEYGALLLATARALGLADEAVEQAPQQAERLREHLNRKQELVDELRRQMDRLTAQNLEQSLALEEIRVEVEGDA